MRCSLERAFPSFTSEANYVAASPDTIDATPHAMGDTTLGNASVSPQKAAEVGNASLRAPSALAGVLARRAESCVRCGGYPAMVRPPLTLRTWPVM